MFTSIKRLFRRLLPLQSLRRFLHNTDPAAITAEELAQTFSATTPASIERLWKRVAQEADVMRTSGSLSPEGHRTLTDTLRKTDPTLLSERLSPYHTILEEKEFYRLSDASTRRWLRRAFARFARRHRLPPASATLLWKGETPRPRRAPALLLTAALLPVAIAAIIGIRLLPLRGALLLFLTLPAVLAGSSIAIATVLLKLLPSAPLPLLESGAGHPILTVCVGKLVNADRALAGVARTIAAGNSTNCLLVLTLPDSSLAEEVGDERKIAAAARRAEELASATDASITLLVPPRQYQTRRFNKARYRGSPSLAELAELIVHRIDTLPSPPEAICILPADGTLLPGCVDELAAALFHPLCKQDVLIFRSPTDSPLPLARLKELRQNLLQAFHAPADLSGWGIYRTDALRALSKRAVLLPRLAPQPLYAIDGGEPPPLDSSIRAMPTLLPTLRRGLPILRALLLFGTVVARLPLQIALLLWICASADLLVSALLSLRFSRRFFLCTLPAWRRIAVAFLYRLLLPMNELWHLIGGNNLQGLCAFSLLFGGAVIATGAPLAFLGLFWIIAPLLIPENTPRTALSPTQKAACFALAGELYPCLQKCGNRLPPSYLTDGTERAPYTTPSVSGACLAAEVSACDLGLIDPYTLERRVNDILSRLETLPTRFGLPYARYDADTEEFYQDSRVDTAQVGLYALYLAAAEAGLRAHAVHQPGLLPLAERIARLSARMDLSRLLYDDHTLCRILTPEGERQGRCVYLFGDGGPALFAVLASDSALEMQGKSKRAAWDALFAPAQMHGGRCHILSARGALSDYLLTDFLLPAPKESLIRDGTCRAVRAALREGRRNVKSARLAKADVSGRQSLSLRRLAQWPHLSESPPPIAGGSVALKSAAFDKDSSSAPQPITAPLLCLLLRRSPRSALSHLRRLQQTDPTGGFGDPAHPGQIPIDGIALSLIALAGVTTERHFADRLATLPRFGALLPLLFRNPKSARTAHIPRDMTAESTDRPAYSPLVCLLGDADHGLLISEGRGICLWEKGIPLTAAAPAAAPFTCGRPSGLLLMQEGKLLSLPKKITRRESGVLTLFDDQTLCRISAAPGGWHLVWEHALTDPVDVRFLFCPAVPYARLSEAVVATENGNETFCLCIEYSPTLTVVIAVTGLTAPFSHADPSPFPRGSRQNTTIFALSPRRAEGIVSTPSCMIGGKLNQGRLSVRLVTAASRAVALTRLQETFLSDADPRRSLPLPVPDGSLASRVLEWQIVSLFEASPIPAAMAAGSADSDRDQLSRCLTGGAKLLAEKGFPLADAVPFPLSVNRREGAEALIDRLLSAAPVDAETPLLPAEGRSTYPDGFPRILRGRDAPTPARTYRNGIAALTVSPEGLCYRPHKGSPELMLTLFLTHKERTLLLPTAATTITYSPAQAVCDGEGFTLRAALLPRLPLLAIYLQSQGDAILSCPTLPAPYKEEANESLYSLSDGHILFVRRWEQEDGTLLLIGSFPRGHDHLYYWIKDAVTPHSLPGIVEGYDHRLRTAASLLRLEGEKTPPLPAIAAAVLASDAPARAFLTPLCAPEEAVADLIRLANSPPTLLFPMALALQVAVTDRTAVAELRAPVNGGRASLYLIAAHCLERAMEEDAAHPLLPPVVAAFARLAERLGDHTGKELYAAFEQQNDLSPARWNALPGVSPETVNLLSNLQKGEAGAIDALLDALQGLPVSPAPCDAALLWSGLLWGVLGFTPSPFGDGFTLAPLPAEREITVLLAYKGEWRIRLVPGEAPICTRADDPADPSPAKEQKIFQNRKISLQSSCIVHKNSVK